jgi:hypothetical protein
MSALVDNVWPEPIPPATFAAACRWWEAFLEGKYPGTRWHVYPKGSTAPEDVGAEEVAADA